MALAASVADELDGEACPCESTWFTSTGEFDVDIGRSARDAHVVVLAAPHPRVHEKLFEHLLLLRAARDSGASRVISVMPYLAYSRSDARYRSHGPVAIDVVRDVIAAAGADALVTLDLHARRSLTTDAMQHTDACASAVALEIIAMWCRPDTFLVAVDAGARSRVAELADALDRSVAVFEKSRAGEGEVAVRATQAPETCGRHAVIVDDALYSGATVVEVADALHRRGVDEIDVFVTHLMPTGEAGVRLRAAGIRHLACTDSTAPETRASLDCQVQVASIASLLANTLIRT